MAEVSVTAHKHCKHCDLPVIPTDRFCSVKCKEEFSAHASSERRKWIIIFTIAFFVMLASILLQSGIL